MKTQTETTHVAVIGSKAQKVRFKGPSMMHAGHVDTQYGIQQSSVCVRDEKCFLIHGSVTKIHAATWVHLESTNTNQWFLSHHVQDYEHNRIFMTTLNVAFNSNQRISSYTINE